MRLLYLVILVFSANQIRAQTQDTLLGVNDKEVISDTSFRSPSVPIQIVAGSATLVGCFYGLGGKELFEPNSSSTFSWYPVAMPVFLGGVVGGIGELTSQRSGSYLASIGGAFVGELIGALLFSGLRKAGVGDIVAYPALVIPPIFLSIFLFNASLSTSTTEDDVSILTFPVISEDEISMSILVRF